MKALLRSLVADTLRLTRITALARRRNCSSLVILCYHRVLPASERAAYILPALAVTPEAFDSQIAVAVKNYRCLPLREAMSAWQDGPGDRPLLSITFDDGYADNAVHAAPILEKHGVRATFFVVSDLIGSTEHAWYDLLGRMVQRMARQPIAELTRKPDEEDPAAVWIAEHFRHRHGVFLSRTLAAAKALSHELRREVMARLRAVAPPELLADNGDRMMSLQQVQTLAAQGHEIGSHTATHPLLPQLTDDELCRELVESKAALEKPASQPVTSLAYPNGDHDDRIVTAARAAGYRQAVTMCPGINPSRQDPLRLRRIYVTQDRLSRGNGTCRASLFELELSGLADRVFFRKQEDAVTA